MNYKAVGFDYGGVISGLPGGYFDDRVASLLSVPIEEYRRVYFTHNKKLLQPHQVWKLVLSELGRSEQYDALTTLVDRLNSAKSLNTDVLDLVAALRQRGYKVGLLSNNSKEKADAMRLQKIDTYFDAFCVSEEIGYAKPEKRAFDYFADQLDVALEELVFIDDEPTSIENSRKDGFTAIRYVGYEQLIRSLEALGIEDKAFGI
ncbi:HAD-IA family hydrolase [Candidatus Saccharibacteria bacterium]|jgi:HAD superfamily hydrolase (TIGR01509 family)|nr:HAD-IA family hydrolase [Candidatus Saccharibacteria bacterium]